MKKLFDFLTVRVIAVMSLMALALVVSSCVGEGADQVHGMINVSFPSTAVCQAQQRLITFRNVSGSEIVIEGVAISGGTDPLGNFALQSVVIGTEETPSINGVLQDVHVPAGQSYAFKVSYVPKTENTTHDALLDIAYKSPKEGVVQVALEGTSASRAPNCPSSGGGSGGGAVGFDGNITLKVELMIAATSAIQAPINTDQGQQAFQQIDLNLTLNRSAGTVSLAPFTDDTFILPPPRLDVPGIGGIIKGATGITLPSGASGTYTPAEGGINIPNVSIHMEGDQDFAADLTITLTTGRLSRDLVSPPVNTSALLQFGNPAHYDSTTREIFGTPIDAATGKIFLVGLTELDNVVIKPGARSELNAMQGATMAVLIEGTLTQH